ncbi:MAG: hypothetical protein ACHRXM_15055 [Isosphaerales bacterium]
MVRVVSLISKSQARKPDLPLMGHGPLARGARGLVGRAAARPLILGILILNSGCGIVPRAQMDECQRIGQTLRSENARLKDRALALQSQNQDYADRAVDDSRRLAIQDEAIERLEHSVQAYQDERARLEAAYKQLTSSLDSTGSRAEERLGGNGSDTPRRAEARSPSRVGRPKSPGGGEDDKAPR